MSFCADYRERLYVVACIPVSSIPICVSRRKYHTVLPISCLSNAASLIPTEIANSLLAALATDQNISVPRVEEHQMGA